MPLRKASKLLIKELKQTNNMKGTLFLVATPIGNLNEISKRQVDTLNMADEIFCENPNNSLKLLSSLGIKKKLYQLNAVHEIEMSAKAIYFLNEGHNVAYISDAGYPCISDPGSTLVKLAIKDEITINVINGSSALLTALCASGLDTSRFTFIGFLSSKAGTRKNELLKLKEREETLIFYESSHRIQETLNIMFEVFGSRPAVLARELTKIHEEYLRGTLADMQNLSESQLKGEYVIIIEGQKEAPIIDDNTLFNEVDLLIKNGLKTKEAIESIASKYNVSKNVLYQKYHKR